MHFGSSSSSNSSRVCCTRRMWGPAAVALLVAAVLAFPAASAQAQQPSQEQPAPAAGSPAPSSVPAPTPANIAVTERTLDGDVDDLVWVGADKDTVFLLTEKKTVYRSKDEGTTWAEQTPALNAAVESDPTLKKDLLSRVLLGVKTVLPSPADPERLFLVGVGEVHWTTVDGGKSYRLVNPKMQLHEVKLHPTNPDLLLASSMSAKCSRSDSQGFCYKNLFVSKDFGQTWKFLTFYVVQFDWAHSLKGEQANGLPFDSIFATLFNTKTGNQRFGYWDRDIDFVRSDDLFQTQTVLVKRGNRFLFTTKYLFVAQVSAEKDSEVKLAISADGGRHFEHADLPYKLNQHSYTILDTSEDTVFLHVNHKGEGSAWGNVYISNAVGLNYSLSLPHNRRDANGKCDFEKIESIEGVYIANFIDNVDDVEPAATQGEASAQRRKHASRVRTVITFDKGGVWGYVRAPREDAAGKPINCDDADCSLHLHGVTDIWGPFYSTASAAGLIMATGNVGPYLTSREDEINTYFSRNGGLEWFEVRKGSHIYEFGDHGALIVMANDRHATKHVVYSWNEGLTWTELPFSTRPVEVENIIIEPTATSQRFLVYGARTEQNGKRSGVVISIDFSEMHMRSCEGESTAGTEESDYELWTPSDGRMGGKCLLGHQVTYTRRKRDRTCFNGEEYEKLTWVRNCPCTEEDYECDVGYARKLDGGPCVPVRKRNATELLPAECPSGAYYTLSTGYRKVAGDTCEGGVDHSPLVMSCPHWSAKVSGGGWTAMLLVLGLVVALGAVTYKSGSQGFMESVAGLLRRGGPGSGRARNQYAPVGGVAGPDSAVDGFGDGDEVDFGLGEDEESDAEVLQHRAITRAIGGSSGSQAGSADSSLAAAAAPVALPTVTRDLPTAPVPRLAQPRAAKQGDLLSLGDVTSFDPRAGDGDAI